MTVDVSTLGIEVKSTGIDSATKGLNDLADAAATAESAVTKLTGKMAKLLNLNASATMQAWVQAMGGANTAMAQLSTSIQAIVGGMNSQITALNNLIAAQQHATRAQNDHAASSGVFLNTLKAMTAAAFAYTGVNFAMSIVHAADEWTNLNVKMVAATGSQNNATVAMRDSYDIAQRLGTPLEGTVKLYARLAPALAAVGFASKDVHDVVVGLSSAFHLGGATTGEMNQAILNFSHSMSSGHMNLRAFNALTAEAPLLLRALATQMTGGNMDALRTLVSAHKVGAKDIVDAVHSVQPAWDALIANRPVTVEMALTRIKNTWLKTIGEMAEDNHFNSALADGLKEVEKLIPKFVRGLGEAFGEVLKWVTANKDKIAEIWGQVIGLGKDILMIGETLSKWVGAIAGAGDDFSLVAEVIFAIRLGIAGTIDGVTILKNAFVGVGAAIVDFLLTPFEWVIKAVGNTVSAFGSLLSLAASGADALGMKDTAKGLRATAQSAKDFGASIHDIATNASESFKAVQEGAEKSTADILAGKGAVGQLLDGLDQAAAAQAKLKYDENFNPHPTTAPDPKEVARALKLTEQFEKAKESLKVMLDQQVELNKRLNDYGLAYDKLGPAQKELIKLQDQQTLNYLNNASTLVKTRQDTLIQLAQQAAAEELINEKKLKQLNAAQKLLETEQATVKSLQEQALGLEGKAGMLGPDGGKMGKDEGLLADAQNRRDAAVAQQSTMMPDSLGDIEAVNAMVKALNEEVEARQRILNANRLITTQETEKAIDKMLDPAKAKKFSDTLVAAFGTVGKGIAASANALKDFTKTQEQNAEIQKKISSIKGDDAKRDSLQADLNEKMATDQVKFYGDMADAASQFFNKKTVGYKVMQDVSAAFHAFEIAKEIYSFAVKSGLLAAFEGLFVASSAVKQVTAVEEGVVVAAAEVPKQTAYGVSALAAALTIPPPLSYVAFAITAAALLAIGVAIAGAGSANGPSSAQRQASQGTGTSLGNDTKQSESISKSITDIASNTNSSLDYSSKMLASLKNIEAALTGVTNSLLVSGTDVTGKQFNSGNSVKSIGEVIKQGFAGALNPLSTLKNLSLKSLASAAGFGSSSSLQDSGLTFGANQTVGSVQQNGLAAQSYQDVQTKHKAFWVTYGTSNDRNTQSLDPSTTAAFTQVINSMVTTVSQAAAGLGLNAAQVANQLKGVSISLGDISLKGLTGDQITKQLEAVFSAFGDKLVAAGLGDAVSKFQQSGEGLLETAVRVAAGVDQANGELGKLGLTAIKFSDIINTSGDVATEIVRQTIMLKEGANGISNIISTLQGSASDLAKTYTSLKQVQTSLQQLHIASDVSAELLNAAGGLDALQSSLQSYTQNFFTSAEQQAMKLQDMQAAFAQLGLQMPNTRAAFVALVTQLSAGGAAGQDLAAKVLNLADGFNTLAGASDTAVSNATTDLTNAYNDQVSAIKDTQKAMTGFSTSLADFRTTLVTGSLSTSNEVDKYAAEKAKYQDILAKAQGGDQTALAAFQNEANAFLTQSRNVYSSSDQYTSDFNSVLAATTALQQSTATQASAADQQLAALNAQVNGLITINASVLTVTQAIAALQTALTTGVGAGTGTVNVGGTGSGKATILPVTPSVNGSHAMGLANVPFDGYIAQLHKDERVLTAAQNAAYTPDYSQYGRKTDDALVNEIKNLRNEVSSLRSDNQQQAQAMVAATYDSNERNAHAVVEGQRMVASQGAYVERARVKLA